MKKEAIINELFNFSDKVRYAAIYSHNDLVYK